MFTGVKSKDGLCAVNQADFWHFIPDSCCQMPAVFIIPDRVGNVQDGLGNFGEFIWNLSKVWNFRQRNYAVPAIPQENKCIIK